VYHEQLVPLHTPLAVFIRVNVASELFPYRVWRVGELPWKHRGAEIPQLTQWITALLKTLTLRAAIQQNYRLLRNQKFHHRVPNTPLPVHILSQMNPIRTVSIFLLSVLILYYLQIFAHLSPRACYMSHPFHARKK
jgi:hypothetical protein